MKDKLEWKMFRYGMKNRKSKNPLKRVLAAICTESVRRSTDRTVRAVRKLKLTLPEASYSAEDIIRMAKAVKTADR